MGNCEVDWSDVKTLRSSLGDGTVGILLLKPVGMGGRYPQRGGSEQGIQVEVAGLDHGVGVGGEGPRLAYVSGER